MNISPKKLTSKQIESAVKELYGIISIKPVAEKGEGIENAAWVFYTDNQNYIIKIFDYSDSILQDVEEEILLYEYLLHHNITVPEVIPDKTNKKVVSITAENISFPAIMMKYENLTRIPASELSQDQLQKIASAISRMHSVLLHYPRKKYIRLTPHDGNGIYIYSMQDFDAFLTSPNANSPYLKDSARLKKIWSNAVEYLQKQELGSELVTSILHNDLALGHILFLSNGEPYIFDFSDFVYGPVSLDLGVLFFNFYREGEITIEEWQSMKAAFLTIYTQTISLSEEDKKAVDIFTVSRMLSHIKYLNEVSLKEGKYIDDKGIKKRYDLLEALYLVT